MSDVKYILITSTKQGKNYYKEFIIARKDGTKTVETTLVPIAKKK